MSSCCAPCFEFFFPPRKPFRPRTLEEGIKACGASSATPDLRAALDMTCGSIGNAEQTDCLFRLLGCPKKNDWLDMREEFGQTFGEFCLHPHRPPPVLKKTILIYPVADLTRLQWQHFFQHLVAYCDQFFPGMSAQLSEQPLLLDGFRCRKNEFGHLQYHVGDVMARLKKTNAAGTYCRLAITVHDLYDDVGLCTDEGGNVGGVAFMDKGLGVFSFARAFPHFYDGLAAVDATFDMGQRLIMAWLRRSRQMMCHELVHMFGLNHCVYFHCLMNGGNGPNDSNAGMLFLCPVCLHKVVSTLSSVAGKPSLDSVIERYAGLHAVLRNLSDQFVMEDFAGSALQCDIAWLEGRLSHLRAIQDILLQSPTSEFESLNMPAPTASSTLQWTQRFDSKDINMIQRAARDAARDATTDGARDKNFS